MSIDTWSIREQLSLASSVMRSGDQNWSVKHSHQSLRFKILDDFPFINFQGLCQSVAALVLRAESASRLAFSEELRPAVQQSAGKGGGAQTQTGREASQLRFAARRNARRNHSQTADTRWTYFIELRLFRLINELYRQNESKSSSK